MATSRNTRSKWRLWAVAIALLWLLLSPPAQACTTFRLLNEGRIVLAKNYDWYVTPALLFVNKRGTKRFSYPVNDRGADWVSIYGNVTFNQYGRDAPSGGMNEVGLVVEIIWMNGTTYPSPDHRSAVDGTGWVQYQLDTARSVDDVLASDVNIRIARTAAQLHYFVADSGGRVAVIEFRDGKRITHTGAALPVAALANDFYADALTRSSQLEHARQPPDRFGYAVRSSREYDAKTHGDPVAYAFAALAQVTQKPGQSGSGAATDLFGPQSTTQWSIVYEIDTTRLHFRSATAPAIKSLSLRNLDFSCATPVLVQDLHQAVGGDASARFRPYSRDANLNLIRASWSQTSFLRGLPEQELERVAARPERSHCVAPVR